MNNKIKIFLFMITLSLIIQGCSNKEHSKLIIGSKALLIEDTVPMRKVIMGIVTFEGSIKQSILNKDFNNLDYYLDSMVVFSVKMGEKTYLNNISKYKVIEAMNNLLSNSQLSKYTLYKTNSEVRSSTVFYLLVLDVVVGDDEAEVNILFTMENGTINSVQLY